MDVKQFRSIKRVPCWYLTIVHNALIVNKVSNEWKVSEQVNYRSVKSEAIFQRAQSQKVAFKEIRQNQKFVITKKT